MATCCDVREFLRKSGTDLASLTNLPPEIASHLQSCTGCLAERRIVWLSEERLRQRLPDQREGSARGAGSPEPSHRPGPPPASPQPTLNPRLPE